MRKYVDSHEWAELENEDIAKVGISDYAQKELGDVVFVELPELNKKVNKGDSIATVESTKAASEIYAPLSGKIIEVNEELVNNPQWINEDPYGKGWIFKIQLTDKGQWEQLMDENSYNDFIKNK